MHWREQVLVTGRLTLGHAKLTRQTCVRLTALLGGPEDDAA